VKVLLVIDALAEHFAGKRDNHSPATGGRLARADKAVLADELLAFLAKTQGGHRRQHAP
jgi:hypothetical protein